MHRRRHGRSWLWELSTRRLAARLRAQAIMPGSLGPVAIPPCVFSFEEPVCFCRVGNRFIHKTGARNELLQKVVHYVTGGMVELHRHRSTPAPEGMKVIALRPHSRLRKVAGTNSASYTFYASWPATGDWDSRCRLTTPRPNTAPSTCWSTTPWHHARPQACFSKDDAGRLGRRHRD